LAVPSKLKYAKSYAIKNIVYFSLKMHENINNKMLSFGVSSGDEGSHHYR
jgi:hypothetical protein